MYSTPGLVGVPCALILSEHAECRDDIFCTFLNKGIAH